MSTISFSHVTFTYSAKQDSGGLRDFDLELSSGGITAILGASGSGKTTLLRLLAGFLRPSAGEISINGTVVAGTRYVPPQQRDLAVVFQSYALWPHLTVEQNLALPLKSKGVSAAERNARITEVLGLVGLEDLRHRRPGQLSGGQQQRVALGRSLALRPALILFDEPLSNLDASRRGQLRNQLKELQRSTGIAFVYVTHDRDEAMSLADHLLVLDDGRLLCSGSPAELYASPPDLITASVISSWAASFTGTVEKTDDSTARILLALPGSERVSITAALPIGPLRAGDNATVLVRPQGIRLARPDSRVQLAATFIRTEFLDGQAFALMRLGTGDAVSVPISSQRSFTADESVQLELHETHLQVFTSNSHSASRPQSTAI